MENTLTQFERTTLWNQLEILKQLQPQKAEAFEVQQKILESGFSTQYWELTGHISANEHAAEMQTEVLDILNMFRALHTAKNDGWTPRNSDISTFQGFFGNDPSSHFSFAQFLLDTKGLFLESKGCPRNSGSGKILSIYRKMLKKWQVATNKFDLSAEEADDIAGGY